jgi:hypothetical protein
MPSIWDLQEERNKRQREVLEACFEFGTDSATQIVQNVTHASRMARELTEDAFKAWISGQMHDWAHEHRRELKQMYVDVEAEYQAAVERRVEEIERILWPSVTDADPATILAMSEASEDTLKAMLETAKSTGNTETFELILKVAHDRDLDGVVDVAIRDNEELESLYAELVEAGNVPLYENPEERFEMLAQEVPSKERLLSDASDKLRLTYGLPSR